MRCEGGLARGGKKEEEEKKKERKKRHLLKPLPLGFGLIKHELYLEISCGRKNASLYDNSQMLCVLANLASTSQLAADPHY